MQTTYSGHLNFRNEIGQAVNDVSHQALGLNHLISDQWKLITISMNDNLIESDGQQSTHILQPFMDHDLDL